VKIQVQYHFAHLYDQDEFVLPGINVRIDDLMTLISTNPHRTVYSESSTSHHLSIFCKVLHPTGVIGYIRESMLTECVIP
jgi:hypothetical protein